MVMNIYRNQELVKAVRTALNNRQRDPEARALLERYYFGPEQWQVGEALLARVEQYVKERQALDEACWALSQQIEEGVAAISERLREHAQAARFAFREQPTLLHALRIERLATRRWEIVDQATHFYEQLTERKLSLQPFGISPKEINEAREATRTLIDQQEERVHRKGRAQHNTQEKQAAITDLRAWLMEFREVARVAFRRQPQLREIFGIPVRSSVKAKPSPAADTTRPGGVVVTINDELVN